MNKKESNFKKTKKEIIHKFIEAYNSFDLDSMFILLHPDILFKNISNGRINVETRGKNEFEKLARQSAELFKERSQKIISFTESGDRINVDIHYNAVLGVDLHDGQRSGEKVDMEGKSEYIIRDNLIISIIDFS